MQTYAAPAKADRKSSSLSSRSKPPQVVEVKAVESQPWGAIAANVAQSAPGETLQGRNGLVIQRKMTLGRAGDQYEEEADRLAPQIVRQINALELPSTSPSITPTANSQVQLKALRPTLQLSGNSSEATISPSLEASITLARGNGRPLEPNLQQRFSQAIGADFSKVRIHTDTKAEQLNRSLNARAFTTKQDLFFRKSEYHPQSLSGQELIAHELIHTLQQTDGSPTSTASRIQRVTEYTQEEDDAIFDYGDQTSEGTLNQKVSLTKNKVLYEDKGSKRIKNIAKGAFLEVLERPSRTLFGKSWAKVKYKNDIGWINTKKSIDKPESGNLVGHESAGVIMPNGRPAVEDIKQMMFGDCFLLAALISLVKRNPNFIRANLFQTDPTEEPSDGKHKVRFFKISNYQGYAPEKAKFLPEDISVKNSILKFKTSIEFSSANVREGDNVGSSGVQAWPAIVEKAFALWPGKKTGHNMLAPGLMSGGEITLASMFLLGKAYKTQKVSGDYSKGRGREIIEAGHAISDKEAQQYFIEQSRREIKQLIIEHFEQSPDQLIGAGTKSEAPDSWLSQNTTEGEGGSGESKVGGVAFKHAYAIISASEHEISLRNPWGRYARVKGQTLADEAVSVLSWDEFFEVFDRVTIPVIIEPDLIS